MMKKILCCTLFGIASLGHAQTSNTQSSNTQDSIDAGKTDAATAAAVAAPSFLGMDIINSTPLNEVWIDSGFLSYHWDRDKNLNGNNYGLGAEYRFSTVATVTAGRFYNSDRAYSDYAGVYYQPIELGPFRLGAVAGGFNGYPHMKGGGWFLAAIPMASAEWGRFGINLAFVPSLQNRLYGAISLQIKVKVWD